MNDLIRKLFAKRTASKPATPIRRARLSMEGLDERVAPALMTMSAGLGTIAAQSRGIVVVGGHNTAGLEQGIVIIGGHIGAGVTNGIVIAGG